MTYIELIRKSYNLMVIVLFGITLIAAYAYATFETTPDELLFKAGFAVVAGVFSVLAIVIFIARSKIFPKSLTIDFEGQTIRVSDGEHFSFSDIKYAHFDSNLGFIKMYLSLSDGSCRKYDRYYTFRGDEDKLAQMINSIEGFAYEYKNRV